jgi:UDP-N-acetylmuramoyl-L-alanyl-D-glutamate--2,6-diaminopimelate ligase
MSAGGSSRTLAALLRGVDAEARAGDGGGASGAAMELAIGEVRDDSRLVHPGDLFVAVPGAKADGRRFLADAIARGAAAVVLEGEHPVEVAAFGGVVVRVASARRALARIAANRFAAAEALALTAVTGTNGKTTTTYILESMLRAAGASPGVIGTVTYRGAGLPAGGRPAPLTTPGALELHALFAEMRGGGATDVVLEASSHALAQGRLDGCAFRVAALTNLTQDHLDYHGTMEEYFEAKAILFERLVDRTRGVAVTFVDDEAGRRMRQRATGARLGVARATGAQAASAEVVVLERELGADGIRAALATPIGRLELASPLVGEYNLANLALSVGMAVGRGLPAEAIVAGAAAIAVPGRLERVANDRGVLCVVDYAHTPDALERAIAAMRPLVAPGGRLIVVFGCGGDRDRGKRPIMGEIAARDADIAIVTSDNPRTEDPGAIVDAILEGVRRTAAPMLAAAGLRGAARGTYAEVDRRAAIRLAGAAARPGDVLLVAGKGHEDYQIVGTTKTHFDDREEAAAALAPGAAA